MSDDTLVHRDRLTGYEQHVHYDEGSDSYIIESRQDVQAHIDFLRSVNNGRQGERFREDMTHIGSVPQVIIDKLMAEGRWVTQDPEAFKRWWNDPDNRAFHSRPKAML